MKTAIELVVEIVAGNAGIDSIPLVVYGEAPNWSDLSSLSDATEVDCLIKGLEQDPGERVAIAIERKSFSVERLLHIIESLPLHRVLGMQSNVTLANGTHAHIPMMDFKCTPSPRNLERLTGLLGSLQMGKGFVLETGRSYHYYSTQIVDDLTWRIFLGKCLLMTGNVDERYVGHQLINGFCVLRLSAGRMKKFTPRVVAEIS